MNKIFTVISLLFIVAYANCTKKVSYSEIVSSLAQVSHVEGADAIIDSVNNAWAESLKKLMVYNTALNNQCAGIVKRSSAKVAGIMDALMKPFSSIKTMEEDNIKLNSAIHAAEETQEGNKKNLEALNEELKNDAGVLQDKTMAIVERSRVLRRLSNLVQDELTGSQRDSTVGNFKVDNKLSGFSFLEVHNQLKELKSHDAIVTSMITTLVLITQDQKNLFANKEQVGKIQNMINEIIKKDAANGHQLRVAATEKASGIHKALSELAEDQFIQMNLIAEKKASLVQNNKTASFMKGEIASLNSAYKRAEAREKSNIAICTRAQGPGKPYHDSFRNV